MLMVDSSVWVDFFAGRDLPQVQRLDAALLSDEEIGVPDIVRLEILSGVRDDAALRKITSNLNALRRVSAVDGDWDEAAALYRICRRNGVTIRSVVDCLIARLTMREGALLLANDRDFAMMVPHCTLRLA